MSRRRRPPRRPRGTNPADSLYPTLDLHGMTADEAVAAARGWLRKCATEGEPTVRVITGRGLHSVGPPVLPGAIEELLGTLEGSLVRGFEREPGGGVYRVRLFDRPASLPPRPSSPPTLDPELVRRAEDALADLGITPTPQLVAAEIRRILQEGGHEAI